MNFRGDKSLLEMVEFDLHSAMCNTQQLTQPGKAGRFPCYRGIFLYTPSSFGIRSNLLLELQINAAAV
jgi:hypothetical protein